MQIVPDQLTAGLIESAQIIESEPDTDSFIGRVIVGNESGHQAQLTNLVHRHHLNNPCLIGWLRACHQPRIHLVLIERHRVDALIARPPFPVSILSYDRVTDDRKV